jgi:hypothetical protein
VRIDISRAAVITSPARRRGRMVTGIAGEFRDPVISM